MAISFFSEDNSPSQLDLPFFDEYIEGVKKIPTTPFVVTEVVKAKSGKGYLVKTDSFICWLWKKSKVASQLLEALEVYVNKGGYEIVIVIFSKDKNGFKLGANKEKTGLWYTDGKKYCTYPIPEESETSEEKNLFL